jgi:SEC-C motif
MKKKPRSSVRNPDQMFSRGPLTVARFGKNLIFKSHWEQDHYENMQNDLRSRFPEVVAEIDNLVSEIADLVRGLSPTKLLHRAFWEMVRHNAAAQRTNRPALDDPFPIRMIDYVQSVIAGTPPGDVQCDEITDSAWQQLREHLSKLFAKVNLEYQMCRRAKERAEDPGFDENLEEFRFRAQLHWCNIRGERYQVHDPIFLREVFRPHSQVLHELFGISGDSVAEALIKIWRALTFGPDEARDSWRQLEQDLSAAVEKKLTSRSSSSSANFADLMEETVREPNWKERLSRVRGLLEMDLFDVEKITKLPRFLLDELSWAPGQEKEFFSDGEFRGWPLRVWPIFRRPFIRLGGRYYCFDLYSLLDHIYRNIQRIVFQLKPARRESWNHTQKQLSESLPFEYLRRLLPNATVFRNVYYRGQTGAGTTDWCETDGLLVYDDRLFVVEARGGAFTRSPPSMDFPAYSESLKNLVLKPAMQGRRFLQYLRSAEAVPLYDSTHQQIGELKRGEFHRIAVCAVTLDPFTEIAAQVQHLRNIGIDVGFEPVWAISVDDLRVYADIFDNPLLFLHYVEQRLEAFRSDVLQSDDELDHLGLYLRHNHYSDYADELRKRTGARIRFGGYRSEIDKFFSERLFDPRFPCPLKQSIPLRIREIIDHLSQLDTRGRSRVAAFLLDLDAASRSTLSESIDAEIIAQPTARRPRPISTHAGVNLTIFCWIDGCTPRNRVLALEHARTVLLANNDTSRMVLELSYSPSGRLRDVAWRWIGPEEISPTKLPRLRRLAEELVRARVSKVLREQGSIGRNERCPCGSGKKYKRCCLGR